MNRPQSDSAQGKEIMELFRTLNEARTTISK